jgi:HAD superfamily hydrolase (TIGR01509 family)
MKIPVPDDIKALIFDCDGTLADSMPLHMEAWDLALSEFGEPFRPGFLESLRGMRDEHIVALYNGRFGSHLDPAAVVHAKQNYYMKMIDRVHSIPEVAGVVLFQAGRLPMAVASGSSRIVVERTLDAVGLRGYFLTILTAEDPFLPKPEPDLFLEAARRLKTVPEQCQVFEDGDVGLEAARRAGMRATDIRMYLAGFDVETFS